MVRQGFEEKIMECIDRGMAPLGQSCTRAILWHIEKNSHTKLSEIPSKPVLFVEALKDMFGPGAIMLERMIVKEIYSAFKIASKVESFPDAVAEARKVTY